MSNPQLRLPRTVYIETLETLCEALERVHAFGERVRADQPVDLEELKAVGRLLQDFASRHQAHQRRLALRVLEGGGRNPAPTPAPPRTPRRPVPRP